LEINQGYTTMHGQLTIKINEDGISLPNISDYFLYYLYAFDIVHLVVSITDTLIRNARNGQF